MQHEWKGLLRAKRKEMLKTFSTDVDKNVLDAKNIFKY